MGAGGSHPQTTLASEEGEEERAAKCESEGKENAADGEETTQEKTKEENTDEPEVTSRSADTITGRGMTHLVREGDERCQANEISTKGKGGRVGKKGTQQIEKLRVMDDIQENHRKDVRKLVEMMQKEEEKQEEQLGRVAPNMGSWWLTPPGHVGPRKERETRGMRWADCEDDERQEEEEREQETEKETWQESGQEELTSEKPAGLEQKEESEHERKEEKERRAQEAREEYRRAQEAREEQGTAQEAREEQGTAQERRRHERSRGESRRHERKQRREQEAREEQKRALGRRERSRRERRRRESRKMRKNKKRELT